MKISQNQLRHVNNNLNNKNPTVRNSNKIFNPFSNFTNQVNEIFIKEMPNDKRYYALVSIFDVQMQGLLDSGASPTLINSLELIEQFGIVKHNV